MKKKNKFAVHKNEKFKKTNVKDALAVLQFQNIPY